MKDHVATIPEFISKLIARYKAVNPEWKERVFLKFVWDTLVPLQELNRLIEPSSSESTDVPLLIIVIEDRTVWEEVASTEAFTFKKVTESKESFTHWLCALAERQLLFERLRFKEVTQFPGDPNHKTLSWRVSPPVQRQLFFPVYDNYSSRFLESLFLFVTSLFMVTLLRNRS